MQEIVKVPNSFYDKLKKAVKIFDIISYLIFIPAIGLMLVALMFMHDTYGLYNLSNSLASIYFVEFYLGICILLFPLALALKIGSFLISVFLADNKSAADYRFKGVVLAIFTISFLVLYYFLMYQRFFAPINHGTGI